MGHTRTPRLTLFVRAGIVLVLARIVFVLGAILWVARITPSPARADAAVVLGAGIRGHEPSPVLAGRVRYAVELHRRGIVRAIVFTGGRGAPGEDAESEVARDYARRLGVPTDALVCETESTTTRGNLVHARRVMVEHGLHTATLVSDPWHLYRARTIARDLGWDVGVAPAATSAFRSVRTRVRFVLRELVYVHLYLVTGT